MAPGLNEILGLVPANRYAPLVPEAIHFRHRAEVDGAATRTNAMGPGPKVGIMRASYNGAERKPGLHNLPPGLPWFPFDEHIPLTCGGDPHRLKTRGALAAGVQASFPPLVPHHNIDMPAQILLRFRERCAALPDRKRMKVATEF